ncbi:MAG TPA: M48 family metalloprotease [Candidatus Aquabacterium excrementipullorum]|nr:M48 family metalloprotease [Candidatus Aquabacterium excrementipullorum]
MLPLTVQSAVPLQTTPSQPVHRGLTSDNNLLPALGDVSSQALSPAAERKLGDRIMRSILRDPDVIDDPLVLEYIASVWTSLLTAARHRGEIGPDLEGMYAWTPFLVRERSVNAFALPGGYIGVHLGLLAMTRTPDELASVLAHEMSHVTQRHIARMISQSKQTSWVGLASMILGVLAASRAPQAAQAMIMGGQGVAIQGQLNFSRDMEREADRVGYGVLTDAGYAPGGMAQMFEQLQQASRLNDDGSYPYLRSHPLTTERIGEARARMGSQAWNAAIAPQADDAQTLLQLRHELMAGRSRVLMDTRSVSLEPLLRPPALPADATPVDRLARQYTAVIAATKLRDKAEVDRTLALARKEAEALPASIQPEARRLLTLAEIDAGIETGRAAQAHATLVQGLGSPASGLQAAGRPEIMLLARSTLNLPDSREEPAALQEVVNALQPHLSNRPDDATGWTYLSSAWLRLNQPLRAVRAEAEASAATGDLQGAIDRVDSARKRFTQPNSAELIELSVLDSRVTRWRQMLRDDSKEDL